MTTTFEFKLPIFWAPYLINSDASSLEDAEQKEVDTFIEDVMTEHGLCSLHCVDVSDSYFSHGHDANRNQGSNVADYMFYGEYSKDE